ncbi:MAG: 50S ribosomal protein L21, partial [Alphaproteobacteria bacterium]|nr:50S ribosomal protein L21 [Alphaproteobacteria bacterium]
MFAVIVTGGKQYKVAEGDQLAVEALTADAGSTIDIVDVRLVHSNGETRVGTPAVEGAKVTAEVVAHGRQDKVIIFKKKRRQNYR